MFTDIVEENICRVLKLARLEGEFIMHFVLLEFFFSFAQSAFISYFADFVVQCRLLEILSSSCFTYSAVA